MPRFIRSIIILSTMNRKKSQAQLHSLFGYIQWYANILIIFNQIHIQFITKKEKIAEFKLITKYKIKLVFKHSIKY